MTEQRGPGWVWDDERVAALTASMCGPMRAWAVSVVGEEEADDIVQEALLRYWRRRSREQQDQKHEQTGGDACGNDKYDSNLRVVLVGLVRDVSSEFHRKRHRQKRVATRVGGSVSKYVAIHVSSPFISGVRRWMVPGGVGEHSDVDPTLRRAIESLPTRARQVFLLIAAHEMTCIEVATLLQLTESTVRAQMSRATRTLRDRLASVASAGGRNGAAGKQLAPIVEETL